ncbi:MAG TPA: hypothetical protein DD738_06315 [Ruminiclostridium sp.]|nr:hypothetical protein [Ruminiclostridium sp.]
MNREQYLLAFYDALGDLPPGTKANVMREYQDYFKAGIEQGKTEEEIAASLGDPFTLAYAVKQRYGSAGAPPPPPKRRKRFRSGRFIWIIIIIAASLLSVNFAVNTKKGFSINFGFNLGTRHEVNQSKEIDLGGIKKIEINTTSSDTTILKSSSAKVKASLSGHLRTSDEKSIPALEVSQSGGTLFIAERRESRSVSFSSSSLKLDISIPEGFDGEVVFKGVSGDFTASDQALKNLTLKLTSGDVELKNILLDEGFEGISVSGNIQIENLSAPRDVQVNSSSGDIRIEDLSCSQLMLGSTSGNIRANQSKAGVSAKTVSGDITLEDLSGGVELKSTSGDIKVTCISPEHEFDLLAVSGDIEISFPAGTGFDLDALTTSGNITCDFDLADAEKGKRSLEGTSGTGEISVEVKTTSGNISMLKK